jgi:hypothetical protein
MITVNLLLALTLSLRVKIEKESSFKIESSTKKIQKTDAMFIRKGSDNEKIKSANFVNNNLKLDDNNINPEINNGKENGIINEIKPVTNNNKTFNFSNNNKKLVDCFFEKTEKTNCDCDEGSVGKILATKKQAETKSIKRGKITIVAPTPKSPPLNITSDFATDKIVGYIFDYFDTVFQFEATYEFLEIYWTLFSTKFDDKEDPYWEKFLNGEIKSFDNKAADKKNLEIEIDFDAMKNDKFTIIDRTSYQVSIAIPQLEKYFEEWKWQFNGKTESSSARNFVNTYDFNGDGRLSPKELLFGVIVENNENPNCNYCLDELKKKFQLIFIYFKCHNDRYVNPTQIIKKLKYLKRQTKSLYNINTCWNGDVLEGIFKFFFKQVHDAEKFNNENVAENIKMYERLDDLTFKKAFLLGYLYRQVSDSAIYAHKEMIDMFNNQEANKDIKIGLDSKVILDNLDGLTKKDTRWDNTRKVMTSCLPQTPTSTDNAAETKRDCY